MVFSVLEIKYIFYLHILTLLFNENDILKIMYFHVYYFKTLHNRIVILKECFIFYSVASKIINLKLI